METALVPVTANPGRWAFTKPELWAQPLPKHHFWNPTAFYKCKNQRHQAKRDIRQGIRQLLDAIGFPNAVAPDVLSVLDAIFEYRNATLHEGYEWCEQTRTHFLRCAEARKWSGWFAEYKCNTKTWLIVVTNSFVADSLAALNSLARSLRRVKEEVESRYPVDEQRSSPSPD